MKKRVIVILLITIILFTFIEACANPFFPGRKDNSGQQVMGPFGKVAWVKTLIWPEGMQPGDAQVQFFSVTVDQKGNVYVLGLQNNSHSYVYGPGAAAGTGATPGIPDSVLVKYGADGRAVWAKTIVQNLSVSSSARFEAVAVDPSGNIYIAGAQYGDSIEYGDGVSSKGLYGIQNPVLVKYNSNGAAQWAYATRASDENGDAGFNALAVDSKGNLYVAGYQNGDSAYTYGDEVIITGQNTGSNPVLVKIDAKGNVCWARTLEEIDEEIDTEEMGGGEFQTVAVDRAGSVYAAGSQYGACNFGNGAIVTNQTGNPSSLLVKYDSDGSTQWARAAAGGSGKSYFEGISVDGTGNIYIAGCQAGTGVYVYGSGFNGPGIPAAGAKDSNNHTLVKYDSNGNACWVRTLESDSEETGIGNGIFTTVAVDRAGSVYAAGYQSGSCNFGNGIILANLTASLSPVLVKYDASGIIRDAWIIKEGPGISMFWDIALDPSSGYLYAAGVQLDYDEYDYGDGFVVKGLGVLNPVLVKFYR